jgi:hypothetical protein
MRILEMPQDFQMKKLKTYKFTKVKSDFDKNAKLDFDKKIKKEKTLAEHSTAANPPPKAHTQKPNGGGYAAVQPFPAIKKKPFFV